MHGECLMKNATVVTKPDVIIYGCVDHLIISESHKRTAVGTTKTFRKVYCCCGEFADSIERQHQQQQEQQQQIPQEQQENSLDL